MSSRPPTAPYVPFGMRRFQSLHVTSQNNIDLKPRYPILSKRLLDSTWHKIGQWAVRQLEFAYFIHLAMDTLGLGCTLPTIRVC
ncbi:hypothetical protein SAMN02746098_05311 [Desulfosporosinus lacus DSM 15449]|uniref:Uncharacterized protein n=1 Tax=Desulfosporosinus lacus DSM 15449 TaxID=1121420 RepID=A0A1M6H8Y3_9FIRM|nr:hypothetical protein SAMN02746098_05311 [Desulfosporosinus lacus DSM 15449]